MKKTCSECKKRFVISKQDYQDRKNKLLDAGEMNLCWKHYLDVRDIAFSQSYFQTLS